MDEAFVDLCRQIIRKDVATKQIREMEKLDRSDRDRPRRGGRKKKKRRFLDGGNSRCNIL